MVISLDYFSEKLAILGRKDYLCTRKRKALLFLGSVA